MTLRILVVGGGGREHAICRALRSGAEQPTIYAAPGNPGIGALANLEREQADDVEGLVALARREGIELVVPGPEAPLVKGLADGLVREGIMCCGPSQGAARLEASKAFTRELAAQAGVPSPRFVVVSSEAELSEAVRSFGEPPVVKADGLCAGKGVFLPDTAEECVAVGQRLLAGELGDAGRTVLLEERLRGTEASLFYACHGTTTLTLPHARDHKRLLDGDQGPNTGGMGAVSPSPIITPQIEVRVRTTIVEPILRALAEAGTPYVGFLYAGVMLTDDGPKLLEFNARLGDPEAQVILPRFRAGHFLALCVAIARGQLDGLRMSVDPRPTCAVVLAAAGYPDTPRTGDLIRVQPSLVHEDRWLDHAGTALAGDKLVTRGGRVAAVVARGATADEARARAYEGLQYVHFEGMHYRRDIGSTQ